MKKFALIDATILLFMVILAGSSTAQEASAIVGKVDGLNYTNSYFGFSLKAPEKWTVLNTRVLDELKTDEKKGEKKPENVSSGGVHWLFSATKAAEASSSAEPPGISGMAMDISVNPGIKKGSDYLATLEAGYKHAKAEVKPIYSVDIGGKAFDALEVSFTQKKVKMTQIYYCAVLKKYALILTLNAPSDKVRELEAVVNSIRFK